MWRAPQEFWARVSSTLQTAFKVVHFPPARPFAALTSLLRLTFDPSVRLFWNYARACRQRPQSDFRLPLIPTTRRQFLRAAAAAGTAAIVGDAIFLAPNRPRIVHQEF